MSKVEKVKEILNRQREFSGIITRRNNDYVETIKASKLVVYTEEDNIVFVNMNKQLQLSEEFVEWINDSVIKISSSDEDGLLDITLFITKGTFNEAPL